MTTIYNANRYFIGLIREELERLRALPIHLAWGDQTPGESAAIERHHHRLELLIELLEPDVTEADDGIEALARYLAHIDHDSEPAREFLLPDRHHRVEAYYSLATRRVTLYVLCGRRLVCTRERAMRRGAS